MSGYDLVFFSVALNVVFIYVIYLMSLKISELEKALSDIKNIAARFGKKEKPKPVMPPFSNSRVRVPSNKKLW
jgi:hypothetical protein